MKLIQHIKKANKRTIKILGFIKINYKIKDKFNKNEFCENVFKRNFTKKVLLSYITLPFIKGISKVHTNNLECMTAAEIFDELGYNVDVIFYENVINYKQLTKYDVVYGFGESFNLALTNPNIKTIYYGTGCCTVYSNVATISKIREVCLKHNVWLPNSGRMVNSASETIMNFSNLIIPLGNDFVKNTYKLQGIKQNIKNVNCFYYDVYNIDLTQKDFKNIKNNFIYFGSAGTLHKGLDLVIDIFKRRKDLNLTICGNYSAEKEFIDYYKDVFDNKYENIKILGFVNLDSGRFREIMDNNIAVICPSVSEGGSPSLLNVMANGGLIPIASKACGVDINEYGFMFESIDEITVEYYIDKLLKLSENELKTLSEKIKSETRETYSYDNYRKNLKNIIFEELCKKQ